MAAVESMHVLGSNWRFFAASCRYNPSVLNERFQALPETVYYALWEDAPQLAGELSNKAILIDWRSVILSVSISYLPGIGPASPVAWKVVRVPIKINSVGSSPTAVSACS